MGFLTYAPLSPTRARRVVRYMFFRRSLRRSLSRVRTAVPALLFTVGVCAGEVGAWFLSPVLIVVTVSVLGLVTIARGVGRGGALIGVGVGLAIGGGELITRPSIVVGNDAQLLLQVEDPPRRRVPGEVVFLGREVTGGEGRLIRCRAVDLPWRSLSSVEPLDIVWVRGGTTPHSSTDQSLFLGWMVVEARCIGRDEGSLRLQASLTISDVPRAGA